MKSTFCATVALLGATLCPADGAPTPGAAPATPTVQSQTEVISRPIVECQRDAKGNLHVSRISLLAGDATQLNASAVFDATVVTTSGTTFRDLPRRIPIVRCNQIVVQFDDANTFLYSYNANVTSHRHFYSGGATPGQLTPFFAGLPATGILNQTLTKFSPGFADAQANFDAVYQAFKPCGDLGVAIGKVFKDDLDPAHMDPASKSSDIKAMVEGDLKSVLKPEGAVTRDQLSVRQGELKMGVDILTKQIPLLAAKAMTNDDSNALATDSNELQTLSQEEANYDEALEAFDLVEAASDTVSVPVSVDAGDDEFVLTIAIASKAKDGASKLTNPAATDVRQANQTPPVGAVTEATESQSITFDVAGGYVLDTGIGVVASNLRNHDYYTDAKGNIQRGGVGDPFLNPSAFLFYYRRPMPNQFAFGPAFGVDLATGSDFYLGAALTKGGAPRYSFVGGLSINKINELNGDKVGSPAAVGLGKIQFTSRYLLGYFLGVTFNFGGR